MSLMKRKWFFMGVMCVVFAAVAWAASKPAPNAKSVKAQKSSWNVGSPVTQNNLTVFPVYSTQPRKVSSEYLTLDEALKKEALEVKEMPDAEVSRVSVTNKASQSIYLISGDIILGGQQDRVIARDTIVPPNAKNFVVEVFCVEHGRWDGGKHFSAGEVASSELRRETQVSKNQQKVWARVAEEKRAISAADPSTSYRTVARSKTAEKDVKAYVEPLSAQLARDKRAVGIVVAVNGKVTAADVFADHKLFEKQMTKVLKSYALDAVQQKDAWAKTSSKPKPTTKDALALLNDAERGKVKTTATAGATINRERESDSVLLFESAPRAAGAAPAHQNFYRKK